MTFSSMCLGIDFEYFYRSIRVCWRSSFWIKWTTNFNLWNKEIRSFWFEVFCEVSINLDIWNIIDLKAFGRKTCFFMYLYTDHLEVYVLKYFGDEKKQRCNLGDVSIESNTYRCLKVRPINVFFKILVPDMIWYRVSRMDEFFFFFWGLDYISTVTHKYMKSNWMSCIWIWTSLKLYGIAKHKLRFHIFVK